MKKLIISAIGALSLFVGSLLASELPIFVGRHESQERKILAELLKRPRRDLEAERVVREVETLARRAEAKRKQESEENKLKVAQASEKKSKEQSRAEAKKKEEEAQAAPARLLGSPIKTIVEVIIQQRNQRRRNAGATPHNYSPDEIERISNQVRALREAFAKRMSQIIMTGTASPAHNARIRVTDFTSHGVDRAIGNELEQNRAQGVTIDHIIDALEHPILVKNGTDDSGRASLIFDGSWARVILNLKGEIITVYPINKEVADALKREAEGTPKKMKAHQEASPETKKARAAWKEKKKTLEKKAQLPEEGLESAQVSRILNAFLTFLKDNKCDIKKFTNLGMQDALKISLQQVDLSTIETVNDLINIIADHITSSLENLDLSNDERKLINSGIMKVIKGAMTSDAKLRELVKHFDPSVKEKKENIKS